MHDFDNSFFDFCLLGQPKLAPFAFERNEQTLPQLNSHIFRKMDNKHKFVRKKVQSRSSMTGFKKAIYNRAKLINNQLVPSYNRRKYNISHYNQIQKQHGRLSRTYGYLSQKKINHTIAFAFQPSYATSMLSHNRPSVKMISLLESQLSMLMYRSLFSKSIAMAGQQLRTRKSNNILILNDQANGFSYECVSNAHTGNYLFPGMHCQIEL